MYSIISRDETHKQGMQPGSISSDDNKSASTTKQPASTGKPTSSLKIDTQDNNKGAAFQTARSQETPPAVGAYEPKKPVSTSTIIAIIFGLVGAAALAACVFLCYRAKKRKQGLLNTHVKSIVDKRGRRQAVPEPIIMAGADIHNNISDIPVPEYRHREDKDGGRGSISSGTDYRNHRLLPTTPALESGGRFPADFHARTGASTTRAGAGAESGPGSGLESRTMMSKGGNALYGPSTGDIRSGPAHPRMNAPAEAGAGAGVGMGGRERERSRGRGGAAQQRPNNNSASSSAPRTPPRPTARERSASLSGLMTPPPSASHAGLGERARHRRKHSSPYQPPPPPPGVGLGIGVGGVASGIGPAAGRSRGNMARRGPPSGPPASLPPMPPIKPGMRGAAAQARPSGASAGPESASNRTETGGNKRRPARPQRRSFEDAVLSDAKPVATHTSDDVPAALKAGVGRGGSSSKGNALGMSHANASTPTLGRYGSLSKRAQPMAESPVLGWMTVLGGEQWGAPLPPRGTGTGRGRGGEGDVLANREPKIPVLPPVAPGERFDHRRWEGTLYEQAHEGEEREMSRERGRRDGHGYGHDDNRGDRSPVSTSSARTSVLFGLEELDRQL